MSCTALIKKADLNRLAALAKSQNVRVELELGGMIIRVSPALPRASDDAIAESALDRELAALRQGMVRVETKGVHKVRAKGRTYYYAWRGGAVLKGEPGAPEFMKSLAEAVESRVILDTTRFRALVTLYKASPDYNGLAASTKKNWSGWLDRISMHFGELSAAQFNRIEKIRPIIRQWRGKYAETPRAADTGMQVLSRVLSYGIDPLGEIASNPCEGLKHLYRNDRASLIWEEQDLALLLTKCSLQVTRGVLLAARTGLRAGDLFRLSWDHVGPKAIIISTGKSNHRREAVIPLYGELRELLATIPKESNIILTNSHKRPWTVSGFSTEFNKAKREAKIGKDLHFHDLRGTAATKFYRAGLSERIIAEILGWEEAGIAKIIRRYVSRNSASEAIILQLDEPKPRTECVK